MPTRHIYSFPTLNQLERFLYAPAMSRARPKRTYRTAAAWRALTPKYRRRLERSGISKHRFVAGVSLAPARGHSRSREHPGRFPRLASRLERYADAETMFIVWVDLRRVHALMDRYGTVVGGAVNFMQPLSVTQKQPLWESHRSFLARIRDGRPAPAAAIVQWDVDSFRGQSLR